MHHIHVHNKADDVPEFPYSDDQIEKLLSDIYDGRVTGRELPEHLYLEIANYLKKGVYKGFGGDPSKFANTPDFDLLKELRENIYMFSAAKTYQQVREISSLLTDGDRVRTRSEFNKIGRETFSTWNDDYGKTEYRTAVASASMASKWNRIEREKDILPNLSYSTVDGACDICAPLDGLTLPVDAPEWDSIYPPNHFNCMCLVTQEEADKELTPDDEKDETYEDVTGKMDDVFLMNSGKDKVIFSDDHPYFDVARKDREFALNNFDLPIPPIEDELPGNNSEFVPAATVKEAEEWARDNDLADKVSYKGLKIVDVANEINRALFELKNKTGIIYDEIKPVNQNNSMLMFNESSVSKKNIPGAKFELKKSTLAFNNNYFNKFDSIDALTEHIKSLRNKEWTTAEDLSGIVWHEIGHRLSSLNLHNAGDALKLESPVFDYKRLGRYASTNIHETISEILAYYKKTGEVPEKWEKLFNKWSDVKMKDL